MPTRASTASDARLPDSTVASIHVMPRARATVVTASTSAEAMPRPCWASTTSKASSAASGAVVT